MNARQMIAEALRNGQRWTRSFEHFKTPLLAMINDGEVQRVRPVGGSAKNMVELTGRGWKIYFGENLVVSRHDQFAELLAQGFEYADAGRELNLTRGETARAFHSGERIASRCLESCATLRSSSSVSWRLVRMIGM